ncbi:similar to Saccharomyces cerevisiae YCR098C GIT1 Plasma membrane permease [Maudiozyma saulgeensis]|uniref:Similar to Saccharomyces cerevisiae YCR098C GIT1 Plasma membrane permease n=1 Tax=Maudiozyma saulgeensis TaxID=1789683 RepID=A0A1X7RBH3_9SACH|nr:similar to Saccharomyces cerevisiae YCR098C GIT1 Plasma membrane permease [Kazachstania saulgeensis]
MSNLSGKNNIVTKEKEEEQEEESHIDASPTTNSRYITYDAEARANRVNATKENKFKNMITIIASGFALISDGYVNGSMSMLNKVFAMEYGTKVNYSSQVSTRVSNASLVGIIFGQFFMGIAADYYSRRSCILVATLILVIGSALCAASHGTTVPGMFWMLTVMRGLVGIGVGSEYPTSTLSANESANEYTTKRRGGILVLVTNFPLAFGGPFSSIIFLIVFKICKGTKHLEALWRTIFALGCFWPLTVFYFRWKTATTEIYEKGRIKRKIPYFLALKFYWKRLLGTCGTWFMYDFVTFPNGIFSSTIIGSVIKDKNDLEKIAEWNLLLGVLSCLGVPIGAYLSDRIGRKYTLMIGFSGYIIFGLIIGCAYEQISKITPLFIIFYALMNMLGNAGPGDMLGVISSESSATAVRGVFYGISAVTGKIGSVVGVECFQPIRNHLGARWTFIIAAICGLLGVLITFFLVPHSLESDLMKQDVEFHNYLVAQGWTGKMGFDEDMETSEDEPLECNVEWEADTKKNGEVVTVRQIDP